LAKEFGLTYLGGGDILKEFAGELGFQTEGEDWWDSAEGMKFLSQRKDNSEFDKKWTAKSLHVFVRVGHY